MTWVNRQPGAIQFATMPFFATSRAIVFVIAETAPLEAVYPAAMCKLHVKNLLLVRRRLTQTRHAYVGDHGCKVYNPSPHAIGARLLLQELLDTVL
jgi:hypothetical protein